LISPPPPGKKGGIDNSKEEVLGKIDGHIVAEIFARQIFEQQPKQQQVKSVAPIHSRYCRHGCAGASAASDGQSGKITRDDVIGGKTSSYKSKDEEQNRQPGLPF
jgi:hypothetical protein